MENVGMFNSAILSAAIGLVAVYIAFSLLVSWIQEQFASALNWRGNMLFTGIEQVLGDAKLRDALFGHPAIDAPTDSKSVRNPSYISAEQFSTALVGVLTQAKTATIATKVDITDLQTQINALGLGGGRLGKQLNSLWNTAQGDWDRFLAGLNGWFDDEMSRISGWYRRFSARILAAIALIIAISFNVDTVQLFKSFAVQPISLQATASPAEISRAVFTAIPFGWTKYSCSAVERAIEANRASRTQGASALASTEPTNPEAYATRCLPDDAWGFVLKILGILLTTIALLLGAPFWFDVLSRLISVRGTGDKPKSTT
jgi:hypothetical protein